MAPIAISKKKSTTPAAQILIIRPVLRLAGLLRLIGRLDLEIWLRYSKLSIRTL